MQATPVYRTNDPFTFKINDFKLPSDLVDDIVNKRYPACLAVLITESLELEGLWVPSPSPNIKDKVLPLPFLALQARVIAIVLFVQATHCLLDRKLSRGLELFAVISTGNVLTLCARACSNIILTFHSRPSLGPSSSCLTKLSVLPHAQAAGGIARPH